MCCVDGVEDIAFASGGKSEWCEKSALHTARALIKGGLFRQFRHANSIALPIKRNRNDENGLLLSHHVRGIA